MARSVSAVLGGAMIIVTLVMATHPGFLLKMSDGSQSRALGNAALTVLEGGALVVCGSVGRMPFLRPLRVATGIWIINLVDPFVFGSLVAGMHRVLPVVGVLQMLLKLVVLLTLVWGLKAALRIHRSGRMDREHTP